METVAMEDYNRKLYEPYRTELLLTTLSDFEGCFRCLKPF